MNHNNFHIIHTKAIEFPQLTFLYLAKKDDTYHLIIDEPNEVKYHPLTNEYSSSMDIFVAVWYQLKCEHHISDNMSIKLQSLQAV